MTNIQNISRYKNSSINNFTVGFFIFLSFTTYLLGQTEEGPKSTADFSFLLGDWTVTRTNNPNGDKPRVLKGTLKCSWGLDEQFVQCTYDMERPGKVRGLDVVYFNYNQIYDQYESLWLSSTWPIKVLLQGTLEKSNYGITLRTKAEFPIQNNLTEYVKDEMVVTNPKSDNTSIERKTYIRTSNDPDDQWTHHMTEALSKTKTIRTPQR